MKFESTGFPKLEIKEKNQELDYYQGMENKLQFSRLKKKHKNTVIRLRSGSKEPNSFL